MDGWQHFAEGGDTDAPDQVVAPAGNVFDQFDQPAKPSAPAATPIPSAPPGNFFDRFDAGTKAAAPPATGGNFFDKFDAPKPAAAAAFTRESPLLPKSQADIDAAAPGSWIKDPTRGDLYQMPAKAEPAAPPAPALDFSRLTPGPKAPTAGQAALHAAERSVVPAAGGLVGAGAGAELGAAIGAFGGPLDWLTVPAGAIIGGGIGAMGAGYGTEKAQEAVTSKIPESVKEAVGQGTEQQEAETKAHPVAQWIGENAPYLAALSPFGAAEHALPEGAGAFARAMQNPVAQRALPAAIMGGQEAVNEKVQGEPLNPWEIAGAAGVGGLFNNETRVGSALTGAGSAVARPLAGPAARLAGHAPPSETGPAAPPAPPGPGAAAAAAPAWPPAIGETFGLNMGDAGVQPVTVSRYTPDGDIVLKDADGTEHPMTPEDVARFRAPLPTGEADAPTPEAAGAPPAVEAPPAQGSARAAVPPAPAEAPRPEVTAAPQMAGEGQPATMEDLEHVAALERAAATGAPVTPQPALATAEATLGREAQGEPIEPPRPAAAPTESDAGTTASVPFMITGAMRAELGRRGYTQEQIRSLTPAVAHSILSAAAPVAEPAAPPRSQFVYDGTPRPENIGTWEDVPETPPEPEATRVTAQAPETAGEPAPAVATNIPENIPAPPDPYQRAVELLQNRGVGNPINAGILRSQLGLSLPDTRSVIDRLSAEGYLAGTGRNMTIAEPGAVPPVGNEPGTAAATPLPQAADVGNERAIPQAAETELATEPERAPEPLPTPAPQPQRAPTEADIGRASEQIFAAYQQGGPDAARGVYQNLVETWPGGAVENARARFQSLVEGSGKPWEQAQQEAGNRAKVTEGNHTKTGAPIVTVQLAQKVGSDEFKGLGAQARKLGGYYSSYRGRGALPGFVFPEKEGLAAARDRANDFAALAEGKAQVPAAIKPEPPLAADEHLGLVSTSLESPATPHSDNPQVQMADTIALRLEQGGTPISARELQQLAEGVYGSKLAEGKFDRATMYDALELGVNKFIAAHPERFDPSVDLSRALSTAAELRALKEKLPTQTVRAGEKETLQQFSTPPDFAYAAAWAARLDRDDSVLEPSAGTGSLAVFAMNAKPREVTVNEISANRAPLVESLRPTRAFRENAEQINNILPREVRPTAVLMNPPFSSAGTRLAGRRQINIGAQHVEQALERLESGGRLVAIVGRGMGQNMEAAYRQGTGAHFADWWRRIGQQYDVRANIGVPGEVYNKYGTNFETRLLVIDKVPPTGRAPLIAESTGVTDLMQRLQEVRDDRPQPVAGAEPAAGQPSGAAVHGEGAVEPGPEPASRDRTAATGVPVPPADTGTGRGLSVGPGERGGAAGQPAARPSGRDEVAPQQPERGVDGGAEQHPVGGAAGRPDVAGGSAAPDAMVLRPEGEPGAVLPPGATSPDVVPSPAVVSVDETGANPETAGPITEQVYEPYRPQRITVAGAKSHPTKLVQTAAMASVMPPETSYAPRLPKALISAGKLSDAQLEAIVYAGHAHAQMLPAIEGEVPQRRGYFIGDGTGVGKGAQVGGIILDNWNQGRTKAVWLSESRTLINDARRDWRWMDRDPKEIFDFGKTAKPGEDVKVGKGIGFLTYDTLKGYERQGKDAEGRTLKGRTRVDQLVDWLGPEFDGVIAFDESHNLANSIQTKGSRGLQDAAQKALSGIELQQRLPNARVVYVSATGATEVSNLAYAERLGLWGHGSAFPNKGEFINQIGAGGVAAMELVARDMKAMGSYISRNLSYDGVEYDRLEHNLSPDQRRIYDDLADGWQSVLNNMEEALLATTGTRDNNGNPKADSRQRSNALSAFWSGHQRFFNQLITTLQMPSVIRGIEGDLRAGRQSVLQLVNTNEASQERAISRARAEEGDLEDLDMTPRDQLMQLVEKSFPVHQMEGYVDENGNTRSRPVRDSAGNLVENAKAVTMRDQLLSRLGSIRVPDGPLELLMNHFGTDKVAEITGRKQRVVRKADERGQVRNQIESRPASANVTEADAFQNAKKPILVFSQAGMTGRSYHADLSSESAGARRSHYLVQAGWRADKAIQGFGRTHRTNQASAPIFHLVTTDLQGQRRFISSIARRLAQLGALTKGERRAGESGMFSARDNLESTEARSALSAFWRDMQHGRIPAIEPRDFEQQTGLKLENSNHESTEAPEITQFLNRLLSLKFDTQNAVFGAFEERLNTAIDRASAAGTLDVGTETLKADRIAKQEERTVHRDPQSGAETKYVRLRVDNRVNPRTFDQVSRNASRGEAPAFYVRSKRSGKVMAVSPSNDVTDAKTGRIIPEYRLTDPLRYTFLSRDKIDGYGAERNWERIDDPGQARDLWNAQVAALPEFQSHDEHLITGALLPIWDRLKGFPKVYRLQTDTGERMLGRTIFPSDLDATLKALGAESSGRTYEPAEVAAGVAQGARASLANGWSLRRSMVADQPRIELIGPDYSNDAELRSAGVFSERIGYRTRYFVPTGDDAAGSIARITERRPVVDMMRGTDDEEGLEEPGATSSSAPGARDTTDEYHQFASAYPQTPDAQTAAAAHYVSYSGAQTGNEHLAIVDRSGQPIGAGTSDAPDRVSFDVPGLNERLADPASDLAIHHNHPRDLALSGSDVATLGYPGAATVVAHGPHGDIFAAHLTPEAKVAFDQHIERPGNLSAARAPYEAANRIVRSALTMQVLGDKLAPDAAERLQADMVNRALDAAGLTDYVSTRGSEGLPDRVYRSIVARAAREAQDAMAQSPRTAALRGDVSARLDRSTVVLQPDAAMAAISRFAAGAERGPADAGAADRGAGRVGAEAGRGEAVVGAGGLREEPADFGSGAVDEAVDEAGTPEDTRGYFQRLGDSLGMGRAAPGRGDHFFNILNKDFTFPRSKASLDPRSSQKWQAELAKKRYATALADGYHDGLASWTGKPPETWRKVFGAMEILTLEGRQVPLDGRAVIAENSRFPFAAHSKIGDTIRLTTPDEIGMFTDYRRTMDKVWKDVVGETARQFGWEGEPSAAAIYKAAEDAGGDTREGKRLRRAAQLVAAIEYQHRNAYLPLMRQGDYFLRVKPLEGTADKPGIPGWTEGFPPTVMYRLLDSMTPFERTVGGVRSGTPKTAAAAIDELRKSFPENEYSIDHGYAFRSADALRDLDIPAIDKLMMLVSNDVRGQMEDRLTRSGYSKGDARDAAQGDYDKLVDSVLDRLYEERVAGFKRQRLGVAGYSGDFARSTGQYTHWLANHISTMKHQPEIDAADQAIEHHPDPQTRAFWRDWDRRQEDFGNQLHGPLMRLRQGAFYWMLGANAATTAKIMLHGPLRGVPILTTGLGVTGRARAAATYLGASKDILKGFRIGRDGLQVDIAAGARDGAERALVADAERQAIVHPQTTDEMAAVRQRGEDALSPRARGMRRFLNIWSSNVSAADRLTRGAVLLSGYRTAKAEGMETINRVWDRDLNWRDNPERTPEGFAKFLVDQTVGIWGDINRMPFMRSQLGGMLGQFRQYEVGYLSNLHQMLTRMGPEGKVTAALMLGGLGMMGGLVALPFAKDAMQAGQWAYGAITGTTPDWQDDLRESMDWMMPGAGAEIMQGTRPLGIDWSGIGFGDLIGRNAQSPLDLLGAAGSMAVGAPQRAIQRERSGQSDLAAFAELTPNAVKHMLQALYPEISLYSASGSTKIAEAPTEADRVRTGLGFQLGSRAEHFQQSSEAYRRSDAAHAALTMAENRIANLRDRGEPINDALVDAEHVIQQGERSGVFSPTEVSTFRRDLQHKFQQRANPQAGSPTMRRIQAMQPTVQQ